MLQLPQGERGTHTNQHTRRQRTVCTENGSVQQVHPYENQ